MATYSIAFGATIVSSPNTPRTSDAMNDHTSPSLFVMGGGFLPVPDRVTLPFETPAGVKARSSKALNVRLRDLMRGRRRAVTSVW